MTKKRKKKASKKKINKRKLEIKINEKIIEFTYYYKFNKEGIYTIEYSLIRNDEELVNTLFTGNSYLVPITKNVMTEVSRKTIIMNYLGILCFFQVYY